MLSLTSRTTTTNAINNLNRTNSQLQRTLQRISGGKRITKAADDASRSAMADRMEGKTMALRAAERSANQGVSIAQIAEGATGSVASILKRMRELAVQSASDTLNDSERLYVDAERIQLVDEIDRIAGDTLYGKIELTSGSITSIAVQVGAGASGYDSIDMDLGDLTSATLGVDSLDLSSSGSAGTALGDIDAALRLTNNYRSAYGAATNRLEAAASFVRTEIQSVAAATSRIVDTDMAFEASEMARLQINQAASIAVLGQANRIDRSTAESILAVL